MKNTLRSIAILCTALMLAGWADSNREPAPAKPAATQAETGPKQACTADADCWCRKFNGAKFLDGKSPGKCDKGRCAPCLYD